MIDRYFTKDMKRIWSDENRFKTWEKVEIAVAEVMMEMSIIPKKSFLTIKKKSKLLSLVWYKINKSEEIQA